MINRPKWMENVVAIIWIWVFMCRKLLSWYLSVFIENLARFYGIVDGSNFYVNLLFYWFFSYIEFVWFLNVDKKRSSNGNFHGSCEIELYNSDAICNPPNPQDPRLSNVNFHRNRKPRDSNKNWIIERHITWRSIGISIKGYYGLFRKSKILKKETMDHSQLWGQIVIENFYCLIIIILEKI
jgi:hypothetical protein